ncbi:unnamed protein product [Adineta steineri]|uniref:Uncharacterized protein n=1 Tax=Adineta steineri TaxID=433720 RepID=A0A813NHZ9_9BILA|nr:unnamed protein product [Adineta steineri]CAF1653018.1 unnamed protein product [Adineta steineri]
MDKKLFTCIRNKNELLYASYQEVLVDIGESGNLDQLSVGVVITKLLKVVFCGPLFMAFLGVGFGLGVLGDVFYNVSMDSEAQLHMLDRQRNILTHLEFLKKFLGTMGHQIETKMIEWIDNEHKKFRNKVNGYYKVVCRTLEHRGHAYELARSFAPQLARIECRSEASLNLAAHHGSSPIIDEQIVLGTGGFFTVHPASWENENELVAKKLRDHITNQDFSYLEAHFHRTITKLNIPYMVHLKYLYEGNSSALYLLLPRYESDLHSFLQDNMNKITADKAIRISHDIASVIAYMHAHDLVHRDIKVQNILVDKHEKVYLADFVPSSSSASSHSSHQYSYEGTEVDVYLLGLLMYACAPKDSYIAPCDNTSEQLHLLDRRRVPERYCQLIARCLNKESKQRPSAKEIVTELDAIDGKLCIICEDALHFVRLHPCGHKVVCFECLEQLRRNFTNIQCIICKQAFTDIREDNDSSTFIQLH